MAFTADMESVDPDVYYESEGLQLMTNVYEGLLRYKSGSADLQPALARSYATSPDGLTYTFSIRPGVVFHDGTSVDAEAARVSLQRRIDLKKPSSYMLGSVASMSTSDKMTLVIHLASVDAAFLSYLASPWGPKLISPTALSQHGGSDQGQGWLSTNDAGTGPYTVSQIRRAQALELKRFDRYWAGRPFFQGVRFSIIPNVTTQRLKLENGELDLMNHGLSTSDLLSLQKQGRFQINQYPSFSKLGTNVNASKAPFADPLLRRALESALSKVRLTKEVFPNGLGGIPSDQFFPKGMLAPGLARDPDSGDATTLRQLAAGLPNKAVQISYINDSGEPVSRMAESIQTVLSGAGFSVSIRGRTVADFFGAVKDPTAGSAPDLGVGPIPPDAGHPDSFIRPFFHSKGAINFFRCSSPEADTFIDKGDRSVDPQESATAYSSAAAAVLQNGCAVMLTDQTMILAARRGLSGFAADPATPTTVRLEDLRG